MGVDLWKPQDDSQRRLQASLPDPATGQSELPIRLKAPDSLKCHDCLGSVRAPIHRNDPFPVLLVDPNPPIWEGLLPSVQKTIKLISSRKALIV